MSNNFFQFPEFDDLDNYPLTRATFIVLVFSLPPLMISSNMVGFDYRNEVALLFSVFIFGYAYLRGFSSEQLGLRVDNIYDALWSFIPCMLLVLSGLFALYYSGWVHVVDCPLSYYFIVFYLFISAPFQEFCYRSLLFAELNKDNYFSDRSKIMITTLLFSMLHIMYFHWTMLILSVCMGFTWGYLYQKTPNLFAASITHFVVGMTAFWLGIAC